MKVGIALPVTKSGFYDAEEVLNLHLEKSLSDGFVYFSTDNRISLKKVKNVDYVLLVSKNFSYLAILFSPEPFVEDENLHWFKISNIRQISKEDLNSFAMDNKIAEAKHHGVGNYVSNTGRLQVFYFKQ